MRYVTALTMRYRATGKAIRGRPGPKPMQPARATEPDCKPCTVGQTKALSLPGLSAPVRQQGSGVCQQSVWEMDKAAPATRLTEAAHREGDRDGQAVTSGVVGISLPSSRRQIARQRTREVISAGLRVSRCTSHSFAVVSPLAVSTRVPSGLNCADVTCSMARQGRQRPLSSPPIASPSHPHSPSAHGCHRG